jgi:hypothetical protein
MIPVSDQPPAPTPIDAEIARNNGTSVAIEATSENMQASKTAYTPSLSEIIDQRTRENGRLRQELEHKQSKLGASVDLLEELRMIVERLQQAINNYQMRTTLQYVAQYCRHKANGGKLCLHLDAVNGCQNVWFRCVKQVTLTS